MSNFLDDNLNQSVFFDINYLEVLGNNTFEYCLYHLLENDDMFPTFITVTKTRMWAAKLTRLLYYYV